MSTKIVEESPSSSVTRRLTAPGNAAGKGRRRRSSWMGETAGECAAVCCCCPCAMAHLLILAVYRLPRGIWRKKKKKSLLRKKRKFSSEEKEIQRKISPSGLSGVDDDGDDESTDETLENDVVEWDDEVWDRFGAGFWRSGSQRKDD